MKELLFSKRIKELRNLIAEKNMFFYCQRNHVTTLCFVKDILKKDLKFLIEGGLSKLINCN